MSAEGKGGPSVTPKWSDAWAAGAHNVVTYFTNATDLRGTALRFGKQGGGRRIGVSVVLAGFLAPYFRAEGIGRGLVVSSGEPWSYTMPHVRHRGNKALFANFAQTSFSKVRWVAPGEYDVLVTWLTRGEEPSCRQKRTRL